MMKRKNFKVESILLCCMAIMCILIGIMGFSLNGGSTKTTRIVSADEALYAQFTDSDQLEGISGMDVDTYIERMRKGYYYDTGTLFPNKTRLPEHTEHLIKIIPEELFREICEVKYQGKEYLFYIKTYDVVEDSSSSEVETERFSSVFILDYDFSYDEKTREAVVKLQMWGSDYQFETVGSETEELVPQSRSHYEFMVLNPQMFASVQNKHALNHFDPGYNKSLDDGIIIR